MNNEFKNKYLIFLDNFNKYGNEYTQIYNIVRNIDFETEYITKLTDYFTKTEIVDFTLFKNTNIKNIWEDIDVENKEKYKKDLNEVIDIGKLISLGSKFSQLVTERKNQEEEEKKDNMDDFLNSENINNLFNSENINQLLNSENIQYFKNMFLGPGELKMEDIYVKLKISFEQIFPEYITLFNDNKDKIDYISKINEYYKLVQEHINIDEWKQKLENINFDMKNPQLIINTIKNLIEELKSNNDIKGVFEYITKDSMKTFKDLNINIEDMKENINNKKYDLFKTILNSFNITSNKFELIRQFVKQFGFSQQPKISKEKRRKLARCKYRKELKKKYKNKKKRKRRN